LVFGFAKKLYYIGCRDSLVVVRVVGSSRVGGVGWGPIAELGTVLLAGCGLHRGQLWNLLTLVVYQVRAVGGVLLVFFCGALVAVVN
jgi:hypothetical protein